MINKIKIKNFKKFKDVELELTTPLTLLVGPNNGGKTTALQSIALWSNLITNWEAKKGSRSGSKAKTRRGAVLTRNELYAVPVHEMRFLWHNTSTQGEKSERNNIQLEMEGSDSSGSNWVYGIEATYNTQQTLSCKPIGNNANVPEEAKSVYHLPPLSGVQTDEAALEVGAQNQIIAQGRPGEVLRNILLKVFKDGKWEKLKDDVSRIFDVELRNINFNPASDASIIVDYEADYIGGSRQKAHLEVSTSGAGFLQFLLLAGFVYSHPNSLLLLDEPDSHMHVLLQRGVYDWLQTIAVEQNMQLVISTHSEVLINSTDPKFITVFHGKKPYRVLQSRDAADIVNKLSNVDVIEAESKNFVLFMEGDTDLRIIKEFARLIRPELYRKLEKCFFIASGNNVSGDVRKKFELLRIVNDSITGLYIRDQVSHTQIQNIPDGLTYDYWTEKEIENYLLIPSALEDFVVERGYGGLFTNSDTQKARNYLKESVAPKYYNDPLNNAHGEKGSEFLAAMFNELKIGINKSNYWQIVKYIPKDKIKDDVVKMLQKIEEAMDSDNGPK